MNPQGNENLGAPVAPAEQNTAPAAPAPADDDLSLDFDPFKDQGGGKFGEKFAELARMESQIRSKEDAMRREREEIERYKADLDRWKKSQQLKQEDPLAWLENEGTSYDQLSEAIANSSDHEKSAEYRQMMKRMDELEKKLFPKVEELSKFKQTQAQKEQQERIQTYKTEINQYVKQNAEKYRLLADSDCADDIIRIQADYLQKQLNAGVPQDQLKDLPLERICEKLEKVLVNELESSHKKWQTLYGNQPAEGQPSPQGQAPVASHVPPVHPVRPTLTNQMEGAAPPPMPRGPMSQMERRKAAVSKFYATQAQGRT